MNWKIEGLKRLDAIFGRLACSLSNTLVKPRNDYIRDNPKILVIRPGGIGDAVLLLPALNALREYYRGSVIDVLAEKRNAGVFAICPSIDKLILYDAPPYNGLFKVMNGKYDMVIDTEQWHRFTAAVAYGTRAPVRAGFSTNERARLYSNEVAYSHDDYEAVSFLNLISSVTGSEFEFETDRPFISTGRTGASDVIDAVRSYSNGKSSLAGIFPGASIRERRWGSSNYGEVASGLLERDVGIVLLGGKQDRDAASDLVNAVSVTNPGQTMLNFTGKTSLSETAELISVLGLFISADSGLMHIAFAVGTPTLSLFGAGMENKWAPPGEKNVVLNRNLPCSPCTKFGYTPRCPYGVRCLGEITPREVVEKAVDILDRGK